MVVGLSGPSRRFNLFDASEARVRRAMKSTSCQRRRDDNENEDNRLGDASPPRRMRSVKPNCLRDKSSVSSVTSRLLFSKCCRRRTCVYARSRSSVIRYTWDEHTIPLSFSVWFVRISGCWHGRLTIAVSANREERSCSAGEIEARPLRHLLLRS